MAAAKHRLVEMAKVAVMLTVMEVPLALLALELALERVTEAVSEPPPEQVQHLTRRP